MRDPGNSDYRKHVARYFWKLPAWTPETHCRDPTEHFVGDQQKLTATISWKTSLGALNFSRIFITRPKNGNCSKTTQPFVKLRQNIPKLEARGESGEEVRSCVTWAQSVSSLLTKFEWQHVKKAVYFFFSKFQIVCIRKHCTSLTQISRKSFSAPFPASALFRLAVRENVIFAAPWETFNVAFHYFKLEAKLGLQSLQKFFIVCHKIFFLRKQQILQTWEYNIIKPTRNQSEIEE